jgi:uncharacterized protein YukE
MSAVTLPQLLGADPEAFRRCARGWQALAEDLDNAAEEFLRGTRDLAEVWPCGPAADAAQEKVTQLKAEVCNAYQPARRIYEALRHHGDAVEDLRDQARGLIDAAQRSGFSVDAVTLLVSAPAGAYQGGSLDYTVRAVQSYADQLASLVERARGLDDATANALAVNFPEGPAGFGSESPPAVSRQDVLGQRGRDPREVNAWWLSLPPQQQEQAIADFPELVGWLDGVPASDRDTANRITLARLDTDLQRREDEIRARIAALQHAPGDGTLADQMRIGAELNRLNTELTHVDATQVALGKTHQALDKLGGRGLLLGIDTAGDGKAVIAVGNPDTARHTAVWVPGLGTTLDSTRGNVDRVLHLQEAAETITGVPGSVSTVMWLGYDAPEVDLSVVTSERSRAGAPPLLSFVDGLHATHDDGPNHVTAVGHSYGSTVVGEAALSGRLHVDDIVTAGSPGTHADKATQLLPDARHVWAGSAADDPVSQTSNVTKWTNLIPIAGPWISYGYDQGHGISPHEADFGANRYVVDTSGHNDYWNPGSRSIQNQASIVVGEYSKAALDHGQAPPDIP